MVPIPRWTRAVLPRAALLLLFGGTSPLYAQDTGVISGTVRGERASQPIPGASIHVVGVNRASLTNQAGRYILTGVPAGEQTVRVEVIGYARAEARVTVLPNQTVTADFDLDRQVFELDQIVVTGTAGAQSKREIGNSVSGITVGDQLEVAPINNANELLTARAPGLTLMTNSGQAGSSSNIRIRGAGSLSGGYAPVFYVDGIRIESGNMEGLSTYQGGTALDFLNPDDIERIEVIKGPAASTLYGADAANGVIQIITKKGRRGDERARWTASYELGESEWIKSGDNYTTYRRCTASMQESNSYPGCQIVAGNRDPGDLEWWAKDSDGDPVLRTGIPENDIIRIPGSDEFLLRDDPLFRHPFALRAGTLTSFDASVRGGTQTIGYFLSFNKSDEEGVYFNNFANRIGGRGNFDISVWENLNISTQFSYTRTHLRQPLSNNASNGIIRNAMRGRARAQSAPWEAGFLGFSPQVSNEFDRQNRIERTTIGVTANWAPFEWLNNRLTLGLDKQDYLETDFTRQDTTGRAPWGAISATGIIDHEKGGVHRYTLDYAGTVDFDITESLRSAFSAGMQLNNRQRRDFFATGEGLVANNLNLVSAAAVRTGSESMSEQTSFGLFFEDRLAWRERLYLTGAVRIDDNSAFGSEFEVVVYPKASVSWVISDEEFFTLPYTDDLKLRFAWGRAGNAPDPFSADRTYTSGQGVAADALVNTLTVSEYGNPNLKAETGQEWELGFDASLLEGRAGLELTYYNQKTVDALVSVPDAGSTGFTGTHLVNIGEISNKGLEILLVGTPILRSRFGWDASLSFSTNANELVSFNGAREEIIFGSFADVQRHREGYPLGGFWAYDVERDASGQPVVRDEDGNVITNPVLDAPGQSVTVLNDCRWAPSDPSWNRQTECDDIYMGPSRPTREAALTNTFTLFGNLRLFTQLQYAGGHYQWCAACSLGNRSDLNTWDVNTGGTALNPGVTVADVLALRSLQTMSHISKADFVRLREVSVTYSIPAGWTSIVLPGSQWSATLAGRNLALWTKYKGKGDPEVQFDPTSTFSMLDYAATPPVRRLSASIRVTF